MNQTSLQSRRVPVSDSFDAIQDYYEEQGWTDGLPVVPATEELVRKMLAGYGGDPAAPPVVACTPAMLKAGSIRALVAATTTGKYSGRQPAITALIATFSRVT